jgi:hypothetical protein
MMMSIHWSYKLSAFAGSVVTLSWLFAGWRQVNESGAIADWALLLVGILSTAVLLLLQGYWIYIEEKVKGSLKKNIALYETIYAKLQSNKEKGNSK